MAKLRFFLPTEAAWKQVLSAAELAGLTFPTAPQQLDGLQDLKRMLKKKETTKQDLPFSQLPLDPRNLPPALFAAAYTVEDPPVPRY